MAGQEEGRKLEKLQVVAKKLERMLETTLGQLKAEQKMRKDANLELGVAKSRIQELEKSLAECEEKARALQTTLDEREEELEAVVGDKQAKILSLEASLEFLQARLLAKGEEANKKEEMVKKLRSMIDLYTPPKDRQLRQKVLEPDRTSPSHKTSFKNTDFIDVSPVVRTTKGGGGPVTNVSDQEGMVEVKIEAGTTFEFEGNEQIIIEGQLASENLGKEENQDAGAEDESEDGEEAGGGGVVKLQPRDEKTLQAESLKEIKHKTKCKVCQGEFKNRQALLEHEKISGHYYKYSCRHCGKSFSQKIQVRLFVKSFLERFFTQMKRHEAQLHSSETPYQCSRCDRTFKSEYSWKRHQSNDEVHQKMENFTPFLTCEVCGKQFERRRRWCLDQHMLSHETERRFNCDICGKYFRNSSYLKTHRKACLGVKEEECAFCGKKFAQRAVLINHERLHTGETPYECRICQQSFRTHHIYSGHGKTVHQAISAKHFQQMQDEAVASAAQAAQAEERTSTE